MRDPNIEHGVVNISGYGSYDIRSTCFERSWQIKKSGVALVSTHSSIVAGSRASIPLQPPTVQVFAYLTYILDRIMRSFSNTASMQGILLLLALLVMTSCHHVRAEEAHADLIQPFLGCWDDQFTGTSDSTLLVTESEFLVSYAAGSPPLTFTMLTKYTTSLDMGSDDRFSGRTGISVIAANGPDSPWAPNEFSDFDMILATDEGLERVYYCQIDWNDPTAEEASKPEGPEEIDYMDLEAGCNGYAFSEMRRSVGGRCETDGTDTDADADADADADDGDDANPTSVAAGFAGTNAMHVALLLLCLLGF